LQLNGQSTGAALRIDSMDHELTDPAEESLLQTLRRRYAYLAAWLLRLNRLPEPARLPEPVRPETPARLQVPPRQPYPPRPE
jgi:hypothetical protein